MAHHRRKKPAIRTYSARYDKHLQERLIKKYGAWTEYYAMGNWPAYHDIQYHRRPARRAERAAEHEVMAGGDLDEILWPVSKRPHKYFW